MKKRLIFLLLVELVAATLHAQEGEIIYRDFGETGLTHEFDERLFFLIEVGECELWHLDLDYDGENDFYYEGVMNHNGFGWGCMNYVWTCFQVDNTSPLTLATNLQIGDTLSASITNWNSVYCFPNPWGYYEEQLPIPEYIAVRFPKDDGFCFGWLEQKFEYERTTVDTLNIEGACLDLARITINRMAYCTIPNYPLRLGQTSFDWGVKEDNATAFASIYPNPVKNTFIITGKDLKTAEILNTLGQRVAKVTGQGETLQIDIADLPAGVYFVTITDEEGRKCVKKVMKE